MRANGGGPDTHPHQWYCARCKKLAIPPEGDRMARCPACGDDGDPMMQTAPNGAPVNINLALMAKNSAVYNMYGQ